MFSGKFGRRTAGLRSGWPSPCSPLRCLPSRRRAESRARSPMKGRSSAGRRQILGHHHSRHGRPEMGSHQRQERQLHHRHAAEIRTLPRDRPRRTASAPTRPAPRSRLGNFTSTQLQAVARKARVSDEQAAKNAADQEILRDGVAAANAGNHQAAIDAFTAGGRAMPTCADCLLQHRRLAVAVEELRRGRSGIQEGHRAAPRTIPRRTTRWPRCTRTQKKMDLAAAASAKAAELSARRPAAAAPTRCTARASVSGTRTSSLKRSRRSKRRSRPTPNHADAHFMLAKVYLNLGKLPEAAGGVPGVPEAGADRQERRGGEDDLRCAEADAEIGSGLQAPGTTKAGSRC